MTFWYPPPPSSLPPAKIGEKSPECIRETENRGRAAKQHDAHGKLIGLAATWLIELPFATPPDNSYRSWQPVVANLDRRQAPFVQHFATFVGTATHQQAYNHAYCRLLLMHHTSDSRTICLIWGSLERRKPLAPNGAERGVVLAGNTESMLENSLAGCNGSEN